uniref:PDZ domain-containing protein n=1 Tax=Stegastes partitus TaxID=144197 RepID=A0A3B4ZLA1_9TELE
MAHLESVNLDSSVPLGAPSSRRPCGGSGLNFPQPPPPSSSIQQGRIRAVEVARGRTGYGFTLSGQSPCVLSCILKGSPADYVGLRSGDYILSVNDINVSKASHEDVVKLIGRCSGVLKLVIAEGERPRRHHHQRSVGSRHHSSNTMAASYLDSCSSDDELDGFYDSSVNNNNNSRSGCGARGGWYKSKMDSNKYPLFSNVIHDFSLWAKHCQLDHHHYVSVYVNG